MKKPIRGTWKYLIYLLEWDLRRQRYEMTNIERRHLNVKD